ncbi:ribosomal-protein-alanine N-acetyltransferase [Aureimonas endophytica]|uniref:Ribosomal-protein-alanine N-acetyltransferase n=1 Tax=Aureimonas endophytica TaxID=2027858 RepID=A0A916ZU40_9HYPH|nr:GNAT family protein [Aureimonas endophytica]GGE14283.1 ribosomal-protein-alanine N-acetyltransferase [Aureimonas endophytica]
MGLFDVFLSPVGPVLHGERLVLRLPQMRDYDSWRVVREASRGFLKPWEPLWSPDELTRRAYRQRITRYHQEAQDRSAFTFFLLSRADEAVLGGVTVGQVRRGVAQSCTLGYWMGEAHAGQGLMHAAVELLKPFVFDIEGLHRIEAACLPTNARSIRLLERAGFRREGYLKQYLKIAGVWEDHYLYALLADDWTRGLDGEAASAREPNPPIVLRSFDPVGP